MSIPEILPRWAELDQEDAESGQNNVVEPTNTYKDYGWNFKDIPSRQYINWLFRWIYKWLKFLNDEVFSDQTAEITLGGVSDTITGTLRWTTSGDTIIIKIPRLYSSNPTAGIKQVYLVGIPEALRIDVAQAANGFHSSLIKIQDGSTVSWGVIYPAIYTTSWEVDKWIIEYEGKNNNWLPNSNRTIYPSTISMFIYPKK